MRSWLSGRAPAFQAGDVGSIPAERSNIGVWPSGRAPGLGPGRRWFDPTYPDQKNKKGVAEKW